MVEQVKCSIEAFCFPQNSAPFWTQFSFVSVVLRTKVFVE